ncbi:hypothetical protein F3N42_02580 [Marinihelvus fidelis]|uniref:Saccharopine dehydrogenase NADP binding domain-containing protein n=1 Tax=Marinihelvus fidelis TaxID=2613842 RepID=A0A5N0TFE5_9GAMM|nr:saccharopine dehydrogenase NADP-binding domain-containing protein [Marinihelvus fidelis]KAA9133258.1 hypothetical protein F3N42_02580 [Marinihelvus fidelis]
MRWLIYGAYGYTGELIAREAVARGMTPVLAGRDAGRLQSLAAELGLDARAFALDAIGDSLNDIDLVLHCAGPFSRTSAPMLSACLDGGCHYLDITGEIDVFAQAWAHDERARLSDVVVCPGVGFDVVPTDCMAATLVDALPAAVRLALAFEGGGGFSRGTARTSVEGLGQGGRVRRDGELVRVPLAWKTRRVPFNHAEREAVTIPWGDVFTAWVSTGVPDIEVYMSVPPAAIRRLRWMAKLQGLLRLGPVQSLLRRRVDAAPPGPDAQTRAATGVELWGEVESADGRRATLTMSGPNGYDITVTASLAIVERLLSGQLEGGYYTPSLLMGKDFAASLPGMSARAVELS